MNILLNVAAVLCPIFMAASLLLLFSLINARKRTQELALQLATLTAQSEHLQRDAADIEHLREQNAQYLEQKSIAVTQRQETQHKLDAALAERDVFLKHKDEAFAQRATAEKQLALIQQQMMDTEKRMQDWELHQAESTKAAKASVMEAGGILSNKLLEDYKREEEAAKKEREETAKKTAASLLEQVQTVTRSVAAIQQQTSENREKMSTVWRALTTPAGVGSLSEIGLENSLKNLGLEAPRDYVMQYVVGGGADNSRLRPDAVIFLPQDMVMVIDSKASKYLLELTEAETRGEDKAKLLQGFAKTMNKHLQDLKTKDYEAAIRTAYKDAGRSHQISATHIIMYVPSENAIDHIRRADSEFLQKAQKQGIIIASPASLQGLLSLANYSIGQMRQSESHELIIRTMQQLMDSVITMLAHADKVGKGIKSAADNFKQFSASINRNVLSKMRNLTIYGIKPAKNKEIPAKIGSFEVLVTEDALLIEGEVEQVEDAQVAEDFSKQKAVA